MKTVVLVGCGDKKLNRPAAPARDLYISTYFKKKVEWAERNNFVWYVLSAKYGILAPSQPTKNYNLNMQAVILDHSAFIHWREMVRAQIASIKPDKIILLAGVAYVSAFKSIYPISKIELPLQGLTIGHQMAYLSK